MVMWDKKDLELLQEKGISEHQIKVQLHAFEKGFPYLDIVASASAEKGIMVIPKETQAYYIQKIYYVNILC